MSSVATQLPLEQKQALAKKLEIHPLVLNLLLERSPFNQQQLFYFLYGDIYTSASPFVLSSLKESVDFIREGIAQKKGFYIMGDKDVDGVTSISILKLFFEKLNIPVFYNLPLNKESYGVSERIYQDIISKKDLIHTVITVDCGIKEIPFIQKLHEEGIKTIVTDHHTPDEELPKALYIINPHLDKEHFFPLCGGAIAFKLVQGIYLSYTSYYNKKSFYLNFDKQENTAIIGESNDVFSPIKETFTLDQPHEIIDLIKKSKPDILILSKKDLEFIEPIKEDISSLVTKVIIIEDLYKGYAKKNLSFEALCKQYKIFQPKNNPFTAITLLLRSILYEYPLQMKEKLGPFLEYAGIATLCDRSPLNHYENRNLLKAGYQYLQHNKESSIREVIKKDSLSFKDFIEQDIPFKIGPLINAAGRFGKAYLAVDFLSSITKDEIHSRFLKLKAVNTERQKAQQKALEEVKTHFALHPKETTHDILFYQSENIIQGITGLIANGLSKKYNKPVIILSLNKKEQKAIGSARSNSYDVHPVLQATKDLLDAFGGHRKACGFTIQFDKIPLLQKFLQSGDFFSDENSASDSSEENHYLDISFNDIDSSFLNSLLLLEPFGQDNPKPFFRSSIHIKDVKIFGKGHNHLKIISQENPSLEIIAWKKAPDIKNFNINENLSIHYEINSHTYLSKNTFSAILEK